MKCITAIGLLSAYVDKSLPEQTARAVRFHIQLCEECHTEYVIWKESSRLFKSGMGAVASANNSISTSSTADDVMARILKEEKWVQPVSNRSYKVRPEIQKLTCTVALLILLVFGVMLVGSFHKSGDSEHDKGEWKELSSSSMVMRIDQVYASKAKTQNIDTRYRIVAGIGDPIKWGEHASVPTPNLGLAIGFFGIMVTVVAMSWFTRN